MHRNTTTAAGMTRTYIVLSHDHAQLVSVALEQADIPHMLHRADRTKSVDTDVPVMRFLHTLTTDSDRAARIVDDMLVELVGDEDPWTTIP